MDRRGGPALRTCRPGGNVRRRAAVRDAAAVGRGACAVTGGRRGIRRAPRPRWGAWAWTGLLALVACAPVAGQEPASEARPSSNVRMAQRLEALAAARLATLESDRDNTARLEALRAMPPFTDPGERSVYEASVAGELLRSGRTEEAIVALERLERRLEVDADAVPGHLPAFPAGDAPFHRHRLREARPGRELPAPEAGRALRRPAPRGGRPRRPGGGPAGDRPLRADGGRGPRRHGRALDAQPRLHVGRTSIRTASGRSG